MRFILNIIILSIFFFSCQEKKIERIGIIFSSEINENYSNQENIFVDKLLSSDIQPIIIHSYPIDFYNKSKKLLEQDIKVVIIVSEYNKYLCPVVELAKSKGIKVIAYDKLTSCNVDFYVSFDAEDVGRKQASFITQKRTGNYILIGGPPNDRNSVFLKLGQMEILKPYIDSNKINIILDVNVNSFKKEDSYILLKSYIRKNPNVKIDAIIAADDILVEGVIACLKEYNLYKNVIIAGESANLNSCKRLLDGSQYLSVYRPSDIMTEITAQVSINMIKNTITIDKVPTILLTSNIITKNNIKITKSEENNQITLIHIEQ